MTRSFLSSALLITALISCKNNIAYRPEVPFTYAVSNNAVITDGGKDTITAPVYPGFKANDIVYIDDYGNKFRIVQLDSVKKFKYIVLPIPSQYISKNAADPNVFTAYSSGDTLILCHSGDLPVFRSIRKPLKDPKWARAINPQSGQVNCIEVPNTYTIGSLIDGYKIVSLEPYTTPLAVEFPEEIEEISNDPTHPDLVQVYQEGEEIQLGFYHPKK
jgi:hypothetical protein